MTDKSLNPYANRADIINSKSPDLVANLRLYGTSDGGKKELAFPGWGCLCTAKVICGEPAAPTYDAWPLLDDPMLSGQERKGVRFVFFSPEAVAFFKSAGKFYLWEGRLIGEATIVG